MFRLCFGIFVVLFVVYENEAITFDRCTLARDLDSRNIPRDQINQYICLVQHNSFQTNWSGGPYDDGTRSFGIFQINNRIWCDIGQDGGICDIDCNLFKDDNIDDDIVCAQKIRKRFSFESWPVWKEHCKYSEPDARGCFLGGDGEDDDDEFS